MSRDMHFYTTQKISGKRSRTPEGFLLVEGVPLARIGTMIYGPGEVPVQPGPDGLIRIDRTPDEVFRIETMASANGKPLCDDHPPEDVSPMNWRQLSHGTIMNPRRGVGAESEFFVGDLLVQDQKGIELIESGKVELSMGYDAGYVQTGPGRGYQKDIIYNHVALVDKGRCGPRCSIGDREYTQEKFMTTRDAKRPGFMRRAIDKIMRASKDGSLDEEMLEETLGDSESEEVATGDRTGDRREPTFVINNHATGDKTMARDKDDDKEDDKKTEDRVRKLVADAMTPVLDAIDKKFGDMAKLIGKGRDKDDDDEDDKTEDNEKILGALELEAPPGTNDRARKARDSSFLDDSFRETVALAEVLAPGIRVPTFDRAASPAKSLDTICNLRRTALDTAYSSDPHMRGTIDAIGGSAYKTMDCVALRSVFLGAGELKKRLNNGGGDQRTTDSNITRSGGAVGGPRQTLADINKRNREYYSGNKKSA